MYARPLPQEAVDAPAAQIPVRRGQMRGLVGVTVGAPSSFMCGQHGPSQIYLHRARVIQHADLAAYEAVGDTVSSGDQDVCGRCAAPWPCAVP